MIVALAVLFGQGGGLVLAAFCPHVRVEQPDNACHTNSPANSPDAVTEHHQTAAPEGHAFANKGSDVRCNHCFVHSRTRREESSLQQTNTTQRPGASRVATTFTPTGPALLEAVDPVTKAHGPPGLTAPLYLLVNVFRI